ncbi:hypothetical protein T484DRAFT_1742339 [Baffinella frigidus]|nr:hypothetical protein T484DRAFT_1742339 [Cryptophyta sp. CCMP2293]
MANAGAAAAPLAQLDRAQVREELSLLAILLPPKQIAAALKSIKKLLLNRTRQQNVVDAPKGSSEAGKSPGKLLLLSEIISEKYMSEGESVELLPEECRAVLAGEGCELVKHKMVLEYEHFTYEEALRKVLPSEVEVPGSFETIGHVAHLNLREGHEHFRLVIAQVMIDKFPAIK